MSNAFQAAVAELIQAKQDFDTGLLKSVPYADVRGNALCRAVMELARIFGVELNTLHGIDSRGELHLSVINVEQPGGLFCGYFGTKFAELLNAANVRTGIQPPAHLHDRSGWCIINHFEAENMVLRYAKATA